MNSYSDDELRFMYENGQGHLTFFCIVFCLTRGTLQKKWFMYQNRLGPSNGIYYPNFVPCFVYHQLNTLVASIAGAVVTETEPRAGSVCSVSTLAVPKCCCCSGSQSRPNVENLLTTIFIFSYDVFLISYLLESG